MEADQRARVGATRVDITDFHPGEQSKAVLWVKNFGKSTAVNVNVERYMEPGPERTYWHASGGNAPAVTLFPQAEFPLPVETCSPVPVDEFEAIRTGKCSGMYGDRFNIGCLTRRSRSTTGNSPSPMIIG